VSGWARQTRLPRPTWQEDWSIEPRPYKVYADLPPIPLPREYPPTRTSALEALSRRGDEASATATPDLQALARLGRLSNGLLERSATRRDGKQIEFRTAGGTGARYHLELYFVCGNLPDLEAGVYHYAAHDHALRQLRKGDFRDVLAAATGHEPSIAHAPVVMALTSTFWRNAWRYKARAYRHAFWDAARRWRISGRVRSLELAARLVLGFADAEVNARLGIDGEREATLALCTVGSTDQGAAARPRGPTYRARDAARVFGRDHLRGHPAHGCRIRVARRRRGRGVAKQTTPPPARRRGGIDPSCVACQHPVEHRAGHPGAPLDASIRHPTTGFVRGVFEHGHPSAHQRPLNSSSRHEPQRKNRAQNSRFGGLQKGSECNRIKSSGNS
jgi:SagB-type dehydrogenase family enzyme